jgi:hypothetical protein
MGPKTITVRRGPMQHHAALKPALVTAVDDAEAGE